MAVDQMRAECTWDDDDEAFVRLSEPAFADWDEPEAEQAFRHLGVTTMRTPTIAQEKDS
jgi:hypothetical protein